jgi:hypothetical protein
MKKTIFLFAFLFVSLFASANEVETKASFLNQTTEIEAKEFSITEKEKISYFDITYCVTRTSYYYVASFVGMDGETYDQYEVVVTTTCYIIKD